MSDTAGRTEEGKKNILHSLFIPFCAKIYIKKRDTMNKTYQQDERALHIFFLLSLLLHAIIMLYCIRYSSQQQHTVAEQTQNFEQEKIQEKKDLSEWVETKTRSSYNTTPVYFRDDNNTISADTEIDNDAVKTQDPEPAQVVEPVQLLETELDTQSTAVHIQKEQPTQQPQQPSQQKQKPLQSVSRLNNTPRTPPIAQQHVRRQLPSLAQLTQGVMNYMQEGGNHAVSMIGKKNGVPTDEQLKYERYLERLNQCLHNSFSINSDKQPAPFPQMSNITVYLALNKDGTLHNLKLVKSSGSTTMDLFVMSIFRDASSSFPPVPHYLPHNPFSINYIIDTGPTTRYR